VHVRQCSGCSSSVHVRFCQQVRVVSVPVHSSCQADFFASELGVQRCSATALQYGVWLGWAGLGRAGPGRAGPGRAGPGWAGLIECDGFGL
jgi:hypothetical protein